MNKYEKLSNLLSEGRKPHRSPSKRRGTRGSRGTQPSMGGHDKRTEMEMLLNKAKQRDLAIRNELERKRREAQGGEESPTPQEEGALSKEVREEPGDEMMLARGRIGAGQYAKSWKDKKGARKQGRKAAKLIAQHRSKKRKKADRAEARAQTVSFTTGNLRARRGK